MTLFAGHSAGEGRKSQNCSRDIKHAIDVKCNDYVCDISRNAAFTVPPYYPWTFLISALRFWIRGGRGGAGEEIISSDVISDDFSFKYLRNCTVRSNKKCNMDMVNQPEQERLEILWNL